METFYIIVAVLGMVVAVLGTIYIHYDYKNRLNNK